MIPFFVTVGILIILGALMLLYLDGKILCKHEYELYDSKVIPSQLDMLKEYGIKANTHTSTRRVYITDYKCKKCGKIHRLKASSKS